MNEVTELRSAVNSSFLLEGSPPNQVSSIPFFRTQTLSRWAQAPVNPAMIKSLTAKARGPSAPPDASLKGQDLLLRFFQSQFFTEWIAIQ